FPNGTGDMVPLTSLTLNAENSGPRIGPVIINEVMYNPPIVDNGFAPEVLEFLEIHNTSGASVDLTDWRVRGGIDFDFEPDSLSDDAFLVIVSFDPEAAENAAMLIAFRDYYQIDESVELVGPFSGRLNNAGDRFRLERPDLPPIDEPIFIPRLLEDEVSYDDQVPWALQPDGAGASLTRVVPVELGSDAASFAADGPTPGSAAQDPSVIATEFNAVEVDPVDLAKGSQPTSWDRQRGQWKSFDLTFNEPVIISIADIILTNLGVHAANDTDVVINLDASNIETIGNTVRLHFAATDLDDGVYLLEILPSATDLGGNPIDGNGDSVGGDSYILVGSESNKFYRLQSDFNGDFGVSVFDFSTFSYWFGASVPIAPEYADMNLDGGVSVFDFTFFSQSFGKGIVFPTGFALIGTSENRESTVPSTDSASGLDQTPPRVESTLLLESQLREKVPLRLNEPSDETDVDLAIEQIAADVWRNRVPH
ncbi:MAG: hypothetical protein ACI9HK_006159, partial [Pirellulaceae bacterium]